MVDGFKVGHFGFFRDADLKLRLDEDNLYDQMDANGWVEVWFGGQDVWLPDYGLFNVYMTCENTFFWDIIDENGNRTKTGFEAIHIPYNPHFEPFVGDIIPTYPEEVFDFTYTSSANEESPLISANLWFYTNYFDDEYYRYNLLVLKDGDTPWPNEIAVDIRPMNDTLKIMPNEYIVGYRPKIEYMNQLAVLKKMISGPENKILFKMKVDLAYLSENPGASRRLRVFTTTGDDVEYLLYPKSEKDIIWRQHGRGFINEYQRYLLQYGVMQYMPDDKILNWGDETYNEFMEASNYVLQMDASNLRAVANDIDMIFGGDKNRHLAGYSKLIIPLFLKWFNENIQDDIVREMETILYRVILTQKYFKGFQKLDEHLGSIIGDFVEQTGLPTIWDGNIEIADGNKLIVNGGEFVPEVLETEIINIVMIDGVKQFEDGYVPTSAKWYLEPTRPGYRYAGSIGSGVYKIRIAEQVAEVFCDMETASSYTKENSIGEWVRNPYSNSMNETREYSAISSDRNIILLMDYNIESCCDKITIYDDAGTLIGSYTGVGSSVKVVVPRYARVVFTSDGSVTGNFNIKVSEEYLVADSIGGWMYIATGNATSLDYLSQFGDITDIKRNMYSEEAYGIGWGQNSGSFTSFQTYNLPFSEVKCKISGEYDNPVNGTGYLDMFTSSSGNIVKFIDSSYDGNDGQTLIVDGIELISNNQENLVKYDIHSNQNDTGTVNSLTIKMRGDSNLPYTRRFIYMLCVR